jgi:hypothetical protein
MLYTKFNLSSPYTIPCEDLTVKRVSYVFRWCGLQAAIRPRYKINQP